MSELFVGYMTEVGNKDEYLQIGDELTNKIWPYHVSLAPPAKEVSYTDAMRSALREVARETPPFRVVTGEPDLLGPTHNIPVRKIEKNQAIADLHGQILGVLSARGVVDMTWAGEHYNPHTTYRDQGIYSIGFTSGVGMNIGGFTVFEKEKREDAWRVVDKIRLKGRQNYLFLDVDGVIWSYKFRSSNPEARMLDNDGKAMNLIGRLATEEKAQIVVSSSWRYTYETFDELVAALKSGGAEGEFYARLYDWTPKQKGSRGKEIDTWLRRNQASVLNYAILDDAERYNFLEKQLPYLVTTNIATGFTMRQYHHAKKILQRP